MTAAPMMVVLGLLILAFTMGAVLKFGQAADEAGGIQTGADAAALAGAQAIKKGASAELIQSIGSGRGFPGGMGQDRAALLASKNNTDLIRYYYNALRDRIEVTVRSKEITASGERETATATAQVGRVLGGCSAPIPDPDPSPTPPSPTTPSPSPSGPQPDGKGTVRCGSMTFDVTIPGDGSPPRINSLPTFDELTPRLIK